MMYTIPDYIKMTVESSRESVAIIFAMRVINVLRRLMRKDMKVAAIFPQSVFEEDDELKILEAHAKPENSDDELFFFYENSDEWCCDTAIERLDSLRSKYDINTIVLSHSFIERLAEKNEFVDQINAFEMYMDNHDITVISCWRDDQKQQELKELFSDASSWICMPFHNFCRVMLNDFYDKHYSFILPRGMLPYFMIDPKTSVKEILTGYEFNMLIGFQPWSYCDIVNNHREIEFPMWHMLPVEFEGMHVGPVPVHTEQIF